jgi:hypothetical protein
MNHDPLIALDEKQISKFKGKYKAPYLLRILMSAGGVPRNRIAGLLPQDDLALRLLGRISEKKIDIGILAFPLTHFSVSLSSDIIPPDRSIVLMQQLLGDWSHCS